MKPTDPVILLCCAIATEEGWFAPDPTVLPRKLNNPGDIDFAEQLNATRTIGTPLATFSSPETGITGLFRQVWLWVAMGQTPAQILETLAPPNENDTAGYIQRVHTWTGLQMDVPMLKQIAPLVPLNIPT
jgi:hypothetical protein